MRVEQAEPRTTVGRLIAESAVFRAIAGGARRFDAAFGRLALPPPDPADELRAKRLLTSSRLFAWIDRALDAPGQAWQSSIVRRLLQPTIDRVRTADTAGRVALLGSVLLVAAATHVVLVLLFAAPVGWPTWVAWIVFSTAAATLAVWPREVVAAWNDSLVRRWLRRGRS